MSRARQISLAAALVAGVAIPLWLYWRGKRPAPRPDAVTGNARESELISEAPLAGSLPHTSQDAVEATDPLSRARILVSFGHRDQAESILAAALKGGELTADAVAGFWAQYEVERARRAATPMALAVKRRKVRESDPPAKRRGRARER